MSRATDAYRGLILDFGGVITTDFYGALEAFCLREGLPADALRRVLHDTDDGRQALAAVETGKISQHDYELVLARLLGLDAHRLLERALGDLQPCQPVLELVDASRQAGIALAVLSNSWGTGSCDPYAGYDLEARFDVVLISDQVGLRKPDPAIYQLSADKLGLSPERCLFVDDTAHNLPSALSLGMAVVLFDGAETGIEQITRLLGVV